MMLPPYDTLATLRILEAIIARHNPATVISLGDNFHDRRGSAVMPETFRQMISAMARGATGSGSTAIMILTARVDCPARRWTSFAMPASFSASAVQRRRRRRNRRPSASLRHGEAAGKVHPTRLLCDGRQTSADARLRRDHRRARSQASRDERPLRARAARRSHARPRPDLFGALRKSPRLARDEEKCARFPAASRTKLIRADQKALKVSVVSEREMPGTLAILSLMNLPMSWPSST